MALCLATPSCMQSCTVGERLAPSEVHPSASLNTRQVHYVSSSSSVAANGCHKGVTLKKGRTNARCGPLPDQLSSSFLSHRRTRQECSFGRRKVTGVTRVPDTVAVLDVTDATFEEEVLKAKTPVLVDFWDTWCGPCKLVAPLMDWAEKEYKGQLKVVKVQADPNPQLVARYKVYGLPTLIIFSNGEEVPDTHVEGAISKAKLTAYLKEKLPAPAHG